MAIEHADDEVLARMNRGITQAQLTETIGRLRAAIPSLALRTSVVVGFPGETEAAFDNLLGFLQRIRFDIIVDHSDSQIRAALGQYEVDLRR